MKIKKKQFLAMVLLAVAVICALPLKAQVNIGTTNPPQSFSVLELTTVNKVAGLRLPQLTTAERDAITTGVFKANPLAKGLVIFNTTTGCVNVWDGSQWIEWCAPLPENICHDTSTKGTDFWVSFGKNSDVSNFLLMLKISAEESTEVTLAFEADGSTTTYTIGNNSLTTIDLSAVQGLGDKRGAVYLSNTAGGVYNNTLHITSLKPISVYAFNAGTATTDATLVLPVDAWGKDYYRLSYAPLSGNSDFDFEMIIANQDNTGIFLNSSATPLTTLSKGQVYVTTSVGDMTGRHITSDKPVAYFTHTTISTVPSERNYADILFEQLMPVNRWGKRFLVPNAPQGANNMNNHIRIIASESGTTVNFTGANVVTVDAYNNPIPGETIINSGGTLNAGQWVELEIPGGVSNNTGACYIEADKPVGVAAYMVGAGSSFTDPLGDPSIAWIPPLNQSILSSIISPFMFPIGVVNNNTNFDGIRTGGLCDVLHYMIIITSTDKKQQTTVNGTIIPGTWIDNAVSGYSYYYWYFDNVADLNNIFKIENPGGVIVLCGGITAVESYYYNAGSGTCIIN